MNHNILKCMGNTLGKVKKNPRHTVSKDESKAQEDQVWVGTRSFHRPSEGPGI